MMSPFSFEVPSFTESDLAYAASVLKIDKTSLFANERFDVATSSKSVDVTACPGSGKTTLLVAKLALLIRNWRHSTRGICVLSHTNVARREIETCLGRTSSGSSLLGYPHYVGTIHGFVNEFLALPWLRSQGYPVKLIDTELVLKRRWSALGQINFKTRHGLEINNYDHNLLSIKSPDFGVGDVRWGKGKKLGFETQTYQDIRKVCRISTARGYFCYEEMFVWGNEILDKVKWIAESLCYRFPLVFIDEAQDNSEDQGAILNRVFLSGRHPAICQRFGDDNQAIFDSLKTKGAETNSFPNRSLVIELPNSHRFGQRIADLATPFAAVPLTAGLKGNGPKRLLDSGGSHGPHTIFLINEDSAKKVLNAYGDLLIRTFSEKELDEGRFFAIGQIHRPPDNEEARKYPHHLCHYWPDYNYAFTKAEPIPSAFIQYVSLGSAKAKLEGEASFAVEKIAEGLLRLACEGKKDLSMRKYRHRQILELLEHSVEILSKYRNMILSFAVEGEPLTEATWHGKWKQIVQEIAEAMIRGTLAGPSVDALMRWEDAAPEPTSSIKRRISNDNFFLYPKDAHRVKIQLGSVHSVKGQTHTATLVLETFWKLHNIDKLMPWVLGEKSGCKKADGVDQLKRMKLQYVAMTRPTHLLCLAVKRQSLEDARGILDSKKIRTLKSRGWQIEDLTIQLPLFPASLS